jgi:hypothetical protein
MKKAITLALALMLAFSLAACGGNETPSGGNSTPSTTSENIVTEQPVGAGGEDSGSTTEKPAETSGNSSSNLPTREEFLSWFGFVTGDFEPTGFVELNLNGCTTKEGDVFIKIDESSGSPENVRAWFESFHNKVKAISDDGKLYTDLTLKDEYTLPTSYGKSAYSQFTYKYNGKTVLVNLGFDPFTLGLSKNEIISNSSYQVTLILY